MITNSVLLAKIEALENTLKVALEGFARVNDLQRTLIFGLRQDNRDMLNRFMSKSFPEYNAMSPASVAELDMPAAALAKQDDFSQEFFPGEIADET